MIPTAPADPSTPVASNATHEKIASLTARFKELLSCWEPGDWPEISYENDTGPNDEGFWEWWEIEGLGKFSDKESAELVRAALTLLPLLLADGASMRQDETDPRSTV